MATSRCERCEDLNRGKSTSAADTGRIADTRNCSHESDVAKTPDSHSTLNGANGHADTGLNGLDRETSRDGEKKDQEKGDGEGPPQPVGIWHPSLKKLRLEVFGLWARTGTPSTSRY